MIPVLPHVGGGHNDFRLSRVAPLADLNSFNEDDAASTWVNSKQPEIYFQGHGHTHRLAVALARFKQPRPDLLERLLIEPHA